MHQTKHPLAGKTVRLKKSIIDIQGLAGKEYRIEDWWDRLDGKSWQDYEGNFACLHYSARRLMNNLPMDDEVVYGKVGILGHIIHVSEIE